MLSLFNNSYFKSQLPEDIKNNQKLTSNNFFSENQNKEIIDLSFRELENIKKFFLKF
jgi:hypothetical protein